ncbi:PAS domain S-box-containing protein [Azospirillum sp. OGB3]|uniref:PAS domain S-box protein n=1 Tax=Azospirillum sp. OGB3 TaxID=2587012 RepID=UPI0017E77D78|nr:PAS domain S-box protein [Azospirillum sp. OGB3]MBB3265800.1 PAS domain S-box-containing protein [Azospirillum sp. OGB3]
MIRDVIASELDWPSGGGTMGALIRTHDWAATPLGPKANWPLSLRVVVDLILASPLGMIVLWGPDLIQIYNDCYAEITAGKHPRALGQPTRECWPEVWDFNGPIYEAVFRGESRGFDDQKLILKRNGVPEETWFDLTYSPVRNDAGNIAGVLVTVHEVTKRKRTELALRDSESRFRALVSASSYAIYRMNVDWTELRQLDGHGFLTDTTDGNKAWLEQYIHPDDQPQLLEAVREAIRTKSAFDLEHRVRQADGSLGWTHSRAVPILDADGEVCEWFGTASNITSRRSTDEALRRSEARLSALFARAAVGLSELTLDGRFLRVNDELCRILGRAREEVVGLSVADVTHPDDLAASHAAIEQALRTGETVALDKRYRRPDGTHVWANSGITIVPGNGDERHLLAVTADLTARRETEAALRESEARFRLMADAVPQIVWITDAEGRVEFFNRQWADYTGVAYDPRGAPTTVSDVIADFIHPDDAALTTERFQEAQRSDSLYLVEHRLRSKTGEYRWFLVRGLPYRDPHSGEIARWFGTSTDIHDRKHAEALLQQARDTAEAASREKSNFLASVSHDLRQPVQAANLFLELLRRQPLDLKARDLLKPLSDSMTSLTGMLSGLLEVARLDAGLLTVQARVFDLDELLKRLYGEFQGPAREAKLWLHMPPVARSVRSDPLLVELVLRNLISNAVKYTEQGGVTVGTRVEGDRLAIDVTDTGRGIAPEEMERIFDPYYQIGNATGEHARGFGIGLATVQRVADLLATRVTVRSKPGIGSTFSLTLPLADEEAQVPTAGEGALGGTLRGRTALVVDDEPMVLKALEVTLGSWGVSVHTARTLAQARTMLKEFGAPPDILIADHSLGAGETGVAIISEARRGGTPVTVLVTGDTSAERLAEAGRTGIRMLHKPIDPAKLEALLADGLRGR